jgi:hypothetical protein
MGGGSVAIDMGQVKSALRAHSGHKVEILFCSALADYLNDDLVPMGIAMGCALFAYDLANGKSEFASKTIPPSLFGYPSAVWEVCMVTAKRIIIDSVPDDVREEMQAALA